jgi:hypothetical protein
MSLPGGGMAARIENMSDPPEIYAVARGRATKLTALNDAFLRGVEIGPKQKVAFRSPDGTPVEAFVTKPPGFNPSHRYPTVLHIHGGPVGQFAYGYDFTAQYLAANGYVVVEPNPRGSTGRGQDYIRAIYQTWGITDYDDIIAAVDHVIGLGFADPDRLAVMGYSYGGYMTNTGHHPYQSLQGRGVRCRPQSDRCQLRSRHLPEVVQLGAGCTLGKPGEIHAAVAAYAGRKGHDANDFPRRPRRLERARAQCGAFLPVATPARYRDAARRVSENAPRWLE